MHYVSPRNVSRHIVTATMVFTVLGPTVLAQETDSVPQLTEIRVQSSLDQSLQPVRVWAPESAKMSKTPILVFLHSWSGDYRQDNSKWLREAKRRGWIFLHPNFRGRNDHPEACGSAVARQDVLDALDHAVKTYEIDPRRIYLAGTSGGGHMAMLMAGYHPDKFSAVSAWVGISDLAAWHRFHVKNGKPQRYAVMIEKCLGGPPGTSPKVDAEYKARSPIFHLHAATNLPIHIYAGLHDGHTGSVPVRHSLDAFNVIAKAGGHETVSEAEIQELLKDRPLAMPKPGDTENSPIPGRKAYLQRSAGKARVTIFEGGHESHPQPALDWLAMQVGEPSNR